MKEIVEWIFLICTIIEKRPLIVKKLNSFDEGKPNGADHELGYRVSFIMFFYKETINTDLRGKLHEYFETLYAILVKERIYYIDLIGKAKEDINVSDISLISEVFRYACNVLFLADFVRFLQLRNSGFIQKNTCPIYNISSKLGFSSWVLNYLLEVFILRRQVLDEFEDSILN